ncbi:hypothetical protein ES288_D13G118300v1 [Gossypium darwinii]|uniref:Uncharacterized protein n=1 Tax=Gossypium darwinii TaxID=34276 RepID=A0A5D2A0M6_GOSDA|nr:hypothetical protein ES288_D13G118300v1 [Gossypium darwinii]
MNILRNAIKLHVSVRTVKPIHVLPSFIREPPKRFSTEPDQQQQQPLPDASVNQFLDSASKGCCCSRHLAGRTIRRFGRLYRLDRVDTSDWDIVMPYNGKTVVLQGLPRSAALEDVQRFLSGCEYDSSSIQTVTFTRPGFTNLVRLTTVQFPSHIQAMNACISKNRKICLNNQISVRVLY